MHEGAKGRAAAFEHRVIAGLEHSLLSGRDRPIIERDAVIGGALKDRQLPDILRHFSNELHRIGRVRALFYDGDPHLSISGFTNTLCILL